MNFPNITAPCKGCADRFVGCHSTCDLYKQFRNELDKKNNMTYKEKKNEWNLIGRKVQAMNKITHKKSKQR